MIPQSKVSGGFEKSVFCSDHHTPFLNRKLHSAFLKFLTYFQPDYLFIVGDFIDFFDLSHFQKNVEKRFHLQRDLDQAVQVLEDYRNAAPDTKIIYLWGNHEFRLMKYQMDKPELTGLREFTLAKLLHFKELNIEEVCYGKDYVYHHFVITHGIDKKYMPKHTAFAMLQRYKISGISAHTHHADLWTETSRYTGDQAWYVLGCMADINKASEDYEKNPNWQNCFAYGLFQQDGRFQVSHIFAPKNKFIYNGIKFEP